MPPLARVGVRGSRVLQRGVRGAYGGDSEDRAVSARRGDAMRCDAMCDEAAADSIRAGDAMGCDWGGSPSYDLRRTVVRS